MCDQSRHVRRGNDIIFAWFDPLRAQQILRVTDRIIQFGFQIIKDLHTAKSTGAFIGESGIFPVGGNDDSSPFGIHIALSQILIRCNEHL